mgnify:CR=1 FL=1
MTLGGFDVEIEPSGKTEELDIYNCLLTLYGSKEGEQALDREFGLNMECLSLPAEAAQAMLTAEIIRKTKKYEPRAEVLEGSMKRATASKDASGQRWWYRLSNIAEFADIPEYSVTGNLTLQDVSNLVTEIYTRNYKLVNGTAPPLNKADPIMLTLKSMTELYYMMIQIAEKRTRCAL